MTDQISKFLEACRKHGKGMWTVELELSQATTTAMRHVLKDGSQSERWGRIYPLTTDSGQSL